MATKIRKKTEKKEVSPKEYREFIEGIELEDIFFSKASFELLVSDRDFWREKTGINITENAELLERDSKRFVVSHRYNLVITNHANRKEKFLKISANLVVEYSTKKEITEEIFQVFKKINLPLNTWPYFREYVHSCMGRLNIPPLILPVLKRP